MKSKKQIIFTVVIAVVIITAIAAGIVKTSLTPKVEYIAHRGYSSIAPENTAPSYEEAGKAGFWGAECDVYRTSDGVWVLSHDKNTAKMLEKDLLINDTSYEELMAENVKYGNNIENYPDLKMCTLEEYLEICKKYDMVAVIEVKDEKNTRHCDEIVNLVEKCNVQAVYISGVFDNLVEIRSLCDNPVYYVVQNITQQTIEQAQSISDCGIDFNADKNEVFETDILKQCLDKDIMLCAWTVDDSETRDKLVEYGVNLITTNCVLE